MSETGLNRARPIGWQRLVRGHGGHFSWWRVACAAGLGVTAAVIGALAYNHVSVTPTAEDDIYITKILQETGHGTVRKSAAAGASFEQQIDVVVAVQDAVLTIAPANKAIPFGRTREPRDLYELRQGLCFDRSRVIEKALNYAGLKTRHVAVYSTAQTRSVLKSLFTPQVASHAVTEVKTARGWMLVDSNARWIGLTADGQPFALSALKAHRQLAQVSRHPKAKDQINRIFRDDFAYVIGLFSRHGLFFPPFTPVPDVNWSEMLDNFAG